AAPVGVHGRERRLNEYQPGRLVHDTSLLVDGLRHWRRTVRTHCAYADMERVATSLVCHHTARHWSAPSKVLDSSPCGDHHFCDSVAYLDLEACRGSPPPSHRAGLLCRHARLEWSVLHPRDACVSKSAY